MLNNGEQRNFMKTFEETFGYLLTQFDDHEENFKKEYMENSFKNELFNKDDIKKIDTAFVNNNQQIGHIENGQPLPSLTSEQEARAIAIGLQEIRKMKEFSLLSYNHLTSEFNRVYASYPLLFAKKFENVYTEAHQKLEDITSNAEHFITGNFHNIEAVKNNLSLIQPLKERRNSVLTNILAFYDNKN